MIATLKISVLRFAPHWPLLAVLSTAAFLPFFLGSRAVGSVDVAKIFLYAASISLALQVLLSKTKPVDRLRTDYLTLRPLSRCALVFLLLVSLQLLPLPQFLLSILAAPANSIYHAANTTGSISIDPNTTINQLSWAVLLLGIFFLLTTRAKTGLPVGKYQFAGRSFYLRTADIIIESISRLLVVLGVICCAISLGHKMLGAEDYFGLITLGRTSTRPHFPFTNANQLAQLLELSLATALARFFYYHASLYEPNAAAELTPEHQRPRRRALNRLRGLNLAAAIICAGGLVATLSRAGIGVALIGCCAFICWYIGSGKKKIFPQSHTKEKSRKPRKAKLKRQQRAQMLEKKLGTTFALVGVFLVAAVVIVSFLGQSGQEILSDRIGQGFTQGLDDLRREFVANAWQVFLSAPLLGAGFGCWHLAANAHASANLAALKLDYAHNDYAQLLAEMGLLGTGAVLTAVGGVVYFFLRAWRLELPRPQRVELLGAALAPALVLLHAVVDYPWHVPALALLLTLSLASFIRTLNSVLALETNTQVLD